MDSCLVDLASLSANQHREMPMRTLGTDLQEHGTMKDAQTALRHANITTTANVYMQPIPASVTAAMNSRTRAVLSKKRQNSGKTS
jgi:hypothetical protein